MSSGVNLAAVGIFAQVAGLYETAFVLVLEKNPSAAGISRRFCRL